MYKTILVPIDIDEDNLLNKAITLVENIAKREDPYVHFLYVLPKLPQSSYYRLVMNGDQLDQVCLKKSAEKELKKLLLDLIYRKIVLKHISVLVNHGMAYCR
ncbi:universal stress protein [Proteus mirabilis]|nr:universal stress protein [Proteus mirabilis]